MFYSVATAGTTLASAVSYAFQRDTYKFTTRAYDAQVFNATFLGRLNRLARVRYCWCLLLFN